MDPQKNFFRCAAETRGRAPAPPQPEGWKPGRASEQTTNFTHFQRQKKFLDREKHFLRLPFPEISHIHATSCQLYRARSRLYRSKQASKVVQSFSKKRKKRRDPGNKFYLHFLQVSSCWKALAEIYTMHSFAPFSYLNFFVENCWIFCWFFK